MRGSGRFRRKKCSYHHGCRFQSPSLRGSGRFLLVILFIGLAWLIVFQSPSLRGSGRFLLALLPTRSTNGLCFNPLHCGAVVASNPRGSRVEIRPPVSIPFIAGQWSLPGLGGPNIGQEGQVSIPFIAGQWSLPAGRRRWRRWRFVFQSPSLRGSGRFEHTLGIQGGRVSGFNPLHCGAVVASIRSAEGY